MDPNGGIDPLGQGYDPGQNAVPNQPQFQQQAPMASPQPAYSAPVQQQPVQNYSPQQQYTSAAPTQPPIQDIRPNWQQDLQYQQPAPEQPQAVQPSYLSSFDSFQQPPTQQPDISPDAYSLLADPMTDFVEPTAAKSPKKPLFIILIIVGTLLLLGGGGAVGFNLGYQKGRADTSNNQQAQQQEVPDTNEEEVPDELEEPELTFELLKPTFMDETLTGVMGEQLNATDGLVLNVYNIDTNYTPGSSGGEGQYLKVDMLLGNADDTRPKIVVASSFKLLDEFGETIEPLDALEDGLGSTGTVTLGPGMKARLSVVYEVIAQDSKLQLVRSQPYQVGGETRTVGLQVALTEGTAGNNTLPSQLE